VIYKSGRDTVHSVGYGRLDQIMVYTLPKDDIFRNLSGCIHILARITPCNTENKDATEELTDYQTTYAPVVTDIRNIKGLIGRVPTRGRYGIIDRTSGIARIIFNESDDES
jgi:hypothetical protein